jgi:Icc-related predicted phosphoesterase
MKITVCSDLHLELGDFSLIDAPEADVLVLAGDIFIAFELTYLNNFSGATITGLERARRYFDFITKCCRLYKHVIFLMGNHEHYHGEFNSTARIIKDTFDLENFHFLENDLVEIDGTVFLGCSLWTNMNNEDPQTIDAIYEELNDYQRIMFDDGLGIRDFEPEDTIEEHRKSLTFLKKALHDYANQKVVVVTHHAPSKQSSHPRRNSDDVVNAAYSSDLNSFILAHPQIQYWIHGHTHKRHDYSIGETNIICNPRGYLGAEPAAMQFEWLVIEV